MQDAEQIGSFQDIDGVLWESYLKRGQSALSIKNACEAARMFEIALQKAKKFGPTDWRTLETQRQLALSLMQAREYDRAEPILTELMHFMFDKFGPASPEVLELLRLLATVWEQRAMYNQAASLLKHVMQHHPGRLTRDPDYRLVERAYLSAMVKHRALDSDNEVTWVG
jgi:hypothetical protein